MKRKTGEPKLKALRREPAFSTGLRGSGALVESRAATPSTVLSMFCGCGGLDLGFMGGFRYLGTEFAPLPFKILKALDVDARAIATYRLNLSDHAEVGDLTTMAPEDMPRARVLVGGFPCQDFSSSGPKVGFAGKRGQLYQALVRYMVHHRPDMVVGENVPHLASLHDGRYLEAILRDFDDAGYNFAVWSLFGPDFGLSQSRRRLFLVGVRRDLGLPPAPPQSRACLISSDGGWRAEAAARQSWHVTSARENDTSTMRAGSAPHPARSLEPSLLNQWMMLIARPLWPCRPSNYGARPARPR